MENYTYNSLTIQLEGLNVPQVLVQPVFLFILVSYLFIIVANVGTVVVIVMDKSLHQPMYLLFWNLSVNDVFGNSIMVPRLLTDLLKPPSERLISYYECVVQAFTTHMFSTTAHTVLMIMALDRYAAICKPLRYASIMSRKALVQLAALAWGMAVLLVGVMLGLALRLKRCRTFIRNPFCDNVSLFTLSCESVVINNIYGLAVTVALFTASVGTVVFTYWKITAVCLATKSRTLNGKALKTCSTHLIVYLIMSLGGMTVVILHRFPQLSETRKFVSILYFIIPGSLNPVIYGLQSKEIRKLLLNLFGSKKRVAQLKDTKS